MTVRLLFGATLLDATILIWWYMGIVAPSAELSEQLGRIGRLADLPQLKSGAQELEVIVEWQ